MASLSSGLRLNSCVGGVALCDAVFPFRDRVGVLSGALGWAEWTSARI